MIDLEHPKGALEDLLKTTIEMGGSDLHLRVDSPPQVRVNGEMVRLEGFEPLTPEETRRLAYSHISDVQINKFEQQRELDFSIGLGHISRFRVNIFNQKGTVGAAFRAIPFELRSFDELGLPHIAMDFCRRPRGLVLVTGPTGSGKSTTLATMIDRINTMRHEHIITIEDPIEFVHENQKCLVNQREVHNHTDSFKDALRAALREDPDIVLVGEMRDLETISIAIETAETGHLVFGTLHTTTAASTVDRIIDQFPADRQQQIRVMLSESLRGVIAQTLLPKKGGGRVAALEVLIVTPAISNLIREGKTFQIPSAMQTGKNVGMVMLNDALFEHVQNGTVEPRDAYVKAVDKAGFETMLTRAGFTI